VHQLARVRLTHPDHLGALRVGQFRGLAQHQRGALGRVQPLQRRDRGQRQLLAARGRRERIRVLVRRHRLRQPLADVHLISRIAGTQPVQADPADHPHQVAARVVDLLERHHGPTQPESCTQ
jgi:hypothetical protein